jgi:hypothetical protein
MTYTICVQSLKGLKMYLLSVKITVFWDRMPYSTNFSEEHGASKVEEQSSTPFHASAPQKAAHSSEILVTIYQL